MHYMNGSSALAITDGWSTTDDFTSAALHERRARAAHAHFGAMLLGVLGTFFFAHALKAVHRQLGR